jgi:hypothetical protein
MLRIIDNTLTGFDGSLPSKEDLHTFCKMLVAIGVDVVEISVPAYEKMGGVPQEGSYILHITFPEEWRLTRDLPAIPVIILIIRKELWPRFNSMMSGKLLS